MRSKAYKGSSLIAPVTETPLFHSIIKVGWIPFSNYWPSGVIRIGLPVWKWKSWKYLGTKWAQWAANGPDWMPQAPKPLCLNQFWSWMNSLFQLLALWGNKNWPPSMKVKKLENFNDKSGLVWCKWSNMNSPGIETPLSHPILKLDEFPFPIIGPLGVIRIDLPAWKWKRWKMSMTKRA